MSIYDYRDILSYYSNFSSPRDTRADYVQGERDGCANRPRSDETRLSGYELDIVNQARADISRLRLSLQADYHGAQSNSIARKQQRYEEYESELRDLGTRRDTRIGVATREWGGSSQVAKRNQDELFQAESDYGDLRRELDRLPEMHFIDKVPLVGISFYTLLLIVMSFVELFINKGVFRIVLEGLAAGYAGAMIMGLAIVFFSHLLGIFVRQWKVRRRPVEKLRVWLGIPLILLIVVTSLWELSVIREATLPLDGHLTEIGSGILGLSHEASLLFFLNLGVFLAGTLLSYYRHDPHPDFEPSHRRYEQARRTEEWRINRFEAEVGLIDEEYRRKKANLAARADRLQREIDEDLAQAESLPGREQAEIQKVVAVVTQRVLAYQSGNERARKGAARPRYFGTPSANMIEQMLKSDGYIWDEEEIVRQTMYVNAGEGR